MQRKNAEPVKPLRIQMVLNRYLPVVGGAERQAHQLSIHLHNRGHQVSVLTRRLSADLPQTDLIDDIPVTRLEPIGLSKVSNAIIIWCIIYHLISLRREFDVIHTHTLGPVGLATILAAKLLKKPVILKAPTYGDISRINRTNQPLSLYTRIIRSVILPQWLWYWILRRATAIMAITEEIADEGKQANLDNIVHIPNGVDTSTYHPLPDPEKQQIRADLGLQKDMFYMFYSGRFVHRKRVDLILQALPSILQEYPHCHILLAGSGTLQADSTEVKLREMVQTLNLEGNVTFLGLIDNVAKYLQAVDCFVFPSVTEGMPNAVLEAMASGLPVVASRINGVTDIADDKSAWLSDPGDWESLKMNLLSMLNQPDNRVKRTRNALNKVQNEFSLAMVAEKYEDLYTSLM